MSPLTRLIHVAAREVGLDEDDRRALYRRETGKDSLTLMSEAERLSVLDVLKRSGFKVRSKQTGRKASEKPYVRLIFALWRSIGALGALRDSSPAALKSFVEKRTGVSDPDWLTYAQASPVIEALKEMESRAKIERAAR